MTFTQDVYKLLKTIPNGKVTTYKHLAEALGTKAYRAVGSAMKNNCDLKNLPCFKVVKSDGSPGFYSKGKEEKIRRLKQEGIVVKNNKIINFKKILWKP
ncbi:MAG: MGMT family protein [Candidatus Woesearchaeota archaeon]